MTDVSIRPAMQRSRTDRRKAAGVPAVSQDPNGEDAQMEAWASNIEAAVHNGVTRAKQLPRTLMAVDPCTT